MSSAPSGASAASCSGRERSSFLDWLMSSPAESQPSSPATLRDSARLLAVCERWNRKLHFYSGLFLIVFLWLSLAQTAAKTTARRPLSCLGIAPVRPVLLWPSVAVKKPDPAFSHRSRAVRV